MGNYLLIVLKSFLPIAITSFCLVWWALRKDYLHGATSMGEYESLQKSEKQARKEAKKAKRAERKAAKATSSNNAVDLEIEAQIDRLANGGATAKPKHDFLHSKWMEFGGGFYGVMAFYTYVLIELDEVRDFFVGLANLLNQNLVNLVIKFFIQSIMNFITAITWPVYWLSRIHGEHWLWIIGAYSGYWLGAHAAFRYSRIQAGK